MLSASATRRVILFLAVMAVLLVVASFLARTGWKLGWGVHERVVFMLDVDGERNIPTLFQTCLHVACAGTLALIATRVRRLGQREWLYWAGLAAVFALLGCDEIFQLHERLKQPLSFVQSWGPYFRYGWVAAGLLFVGTIGVAYLPFVLRQPPRDRAMIILAGMLFVLGAVGMEMIAGKVRSGRGYGPLTTIGLESIEELMEMSGLILFLFFLLRRLRTLQDRPQLYAEPAAGARVPAA